MYTLSRNVVTQKFILSVVEVRNRTCEIHAQRESETVKRILRAQKCN